jgi:hypothetical protein
MLMYISINLYYQFMRVTIKIHYVSAYRMLRPESQSIQMIITQLVP